MHRFVSLAVAVVLVMTVAGCETVRATGMRTPKERVAECVQICADVGLKMTAMVVMMNHAGCVCEPAAAQPGSGPAPAASVAAGGTVIAAAAAAAAAQQRQAQQQQQAAARYR